MAQHKSKDWGRGQREENSSLRAKGMPCGKNRALMSWQRAFSSREQQSRQGGDRDIHMLGDTRPQVGAESLPSTTRGRRGLREEPVGGRAPERKDFQLQFQLSRSVGPTLCDRMDRSTPGLPVHHQLPESTQTHVRGVGDATQPSHPPFSSSLQSFPASGSFPMSQLFASGGQSIGVSASASVLPMNTQDCSLGWTGWISSQSKGLSRVVSNTTVQKHQFFSA